MANFRDELQHDLVNEYDKLVDKASNPNLISKFDLCNFIVMQKWNYETVLEWSVSDFNTNVKKDHDMLSFEFFTIATTVELKEHVRKLLEKHESTPMYFLDCIIPSWNKDSIETTKIIKRITNTPAENLWEFKEYRKTFRNDITKNKLQEQLNLKEVLKIRCGQVMIRIANMKNYEKDFRKFFEGSKSFRKLNCEAIVDAFKNYRKTGEFLEGKKTRK